MKPICLKTVLLTGLLSLNGHSSTWSDKVLEAVGANRLDSAKAMILAREPGCGIVSDYSALKQGFAQSPGLAKSGVKIDREIQFILNRNFTNACFTTYRDYVADSTKAESARIPILQLMFGRDHVLNASNKTALGICLGSLLGKASTPSPMKSRILKGISRYAAGADCGAYAAFFTAQDSLLRTSAYQGLAGRVRKNRHSGDTAGNRSIFNALVVLDSASAGINQLKVIASISENYSRDYLLPRCAGSADRIKEVFYRDADLSHPGLIKEAVKLLSQNPNDESLKKAIRYGTQDPWSNAEPLLTGTTQEKEQGLRLLELFPKVASDHEAEIQAVVENGNAEAQ
jgi:hypothetical protein